jgi:peptidoglycan/xylan/chitin deacetylase (PgdA/CDA1 family)
MIKFQLLAIVFTLFSNCAVMANELPEKLAWPDGNQAALSLSFDDARHSQIDTGLALLDKYDAKVTFYVVPDRVKERLKGWKQAVVSGHEIGNHTLYHPCTGNLDWVGPDNTIENYTLNKMRAELLDANQQIQALLATTPESFAYTCGDTTVGRGLKNKSYIPVVAELFTSGRGWQNEAANNPAKVDMAHVLSMKMDDMSFENIKAIIEQARKKGYWLVLAGHEIGQDGGAYTSRTAMLENLLAYAQDKNNKIWIAPVGTISQYIRNNRKN